MIATPSVIANAAGAASSVGRRPSKKPHRAVRRADDVAGAPRPRLARADRTLRSGSRPCRRRGWVPTDPNVSRIRSWSEPELGARGPPNNEHAHLHHAASIRIIDLMSALAIWAVAVFFFGMGVLALVDPERFVEPLGLSAEPMLGTNEIRAVYGGFGIAISALILYSINRPELRPGVFTTVSVALCGMASGRLVSALVERGAHPLMWTVMAVEALLAGVMFVVR
jgi:hypothetical protein